MCVFDYQWDNSWASESVLTNILHIFVFTSVSMICIYLSFFFREWCSGHGGWPWQTGGVHRAIVSVSPWRLLSAGRHAAFAGEHRTEADLSHCVYTPQHTQHCLWEVGTHTHTHQYLPAGHDFTYLLFMRHAYEGMGVHTVYVYCTLYTV